MLRRLIADADVLVENFAPGVMERLGFGYEDLRKEYPGADLLLAVRASAAPGPTRTAAASIWWRRP